MAPARAGDWEAELLTNGISERARRLGVAYEPASAVPVVQGVGSAPRAASDGPQPIAFTGGFPDPKVIPMSDLHAAADRVFAEDGPDTWRYGSTQGYPELRAWLAGHWSPIDGVPLNAENFTLTNGSAGAIANACETFLREGDLVLVEAPSFPGSIRTMRSLGCDVEGVAMDEEGLLPDALEEKLKQRPAKALYMIPSSHNPTGTCLTLERRHRIVELCERYDVLIIEDDAYGEVGFLAEQPPSLFSIARGRGVIKCGSFSKIIGTGLRVGWCLASEQLVQALTTMRFDQGQPPFMQRLIYHYAASGRLDEAIPKLGPFYKHKSDVMFNELRERAASLLHWREPTGGFFAWLELDERVDPVLLQQTTREEGVQIVGGRAFFADLTAADGPARGSSMANFGPSPYIRLAYSYIAEEETPEGIRRLARALERAVR